MTETKRWTDYHNSVRRISSHAQQHPSIADDAEIAENHTRELHVLITNIIAHTRLDQLPEDILEALSELGYTLNVSTLDAHTRALTNADSTLSGPMKQGEFFNDYFQLSRTLVKREIITLDLVDTLRQWALAETEDASLTEALSDWYNQVSELWLT